MRVLILTISYAPNVGGVETHLTDWVRWLRALPDVEADVLTYQPITTDASGPGFEQDGRIRIFRVRWFGRTLFHRLESHPAFQFLYLAPRLLFAGIMQMRRHGPYEAIQAHGLVAIWVSGVLKRFWKIPVLGMLHSVYVFRPDTWVGRRIQRVLLEADSVLSCSVSGHQQLEAYGLPATRAGHFGYWVDQTVFVPRSVSEARARLSLPLDQKICVFTGRLILVKGVRLFLELARRNPDLFFVSAGDGPLEAECRAAMQSLSNYRHLGCLQNSETAWLYPAADLLVVPSIRTEGVPRVMAEALSCGLPVVATRLGGTSEAVTPEVGCIADPSVESLHEAISGWFRSGGTTDDRRRACRLLAEARFGARNARVVEDWLRGLVLEEPLRG